MRPQQAATDGRLAATVPAESAGAELQGLRATCRRQEHVIDTLSAAVSALRRGAAALKAENADLRAANGRVRNRASGDTDAREALDVSLPLDVRAPASARAVLADYLRGRVPASVLEGAQLVVTELVTNSVRHSDALAAGVVVRVRLTRTMIRIEVEDRGRRGVIAARPPDLANGGGLGLNVVQALSERWGLERVIAGGTRVWAQLPRAARVAPETGVASGVEGGGQSSQNGKRDGGRAAATGRRQPAEGTP